MKLRSKPAVERRDNGSSVAQLLRKKRQPSLSDFTGRVGEQAPDPDQVVFPIEHHLRHIFLRHDWPRSKGFGAELDAIPIQIAGIDLRVGCFPTRRSMPAVWIGMASSSAPKPLERGQSCRKKI